MRVSGPRSGRPIGGAKSAIKNKGEGFSPIANTGPAPTTPSSAVNETGAVASLGAVDAVMALQGIDAESDRRQTAMRKGRRMLNALDQLTLAMLDDTVNAAHLKQLQGALDVTRNESGDDGLDNAIGQIEVRAAVELAKLRKHRAAS